jgi:hypothetical protein
MRLGLVAASVAVILGGHHLGWHTFGSDGVTARYPPGWFATSKPLTPVTYPRQAIAIASYRLPSGPSGADGCEPKEALARLPSGGAFVFGWEYAAGSPFGPPRSADFPPRPTHFVLARPARSECLGPSYVLRFRQAGRYFQIHVALGPRATAAIRRKVLDILDSIAVRG